MSSLSPGRVLELRAAIQLMLNQTWQPHSGQEMVQRARKVYDCKFIFDQCGRKWGKTDHGLRECVEAALLPFNDAEGMFYVAPEDQQAKEIVWVTGRLLRHIPPVFVKKIYESEMRVVLKNGRFIKVDGSNNYKAHEGTQPGLLVCDEFKRFKPQFWEVMEPNMAVYNAPVIFMGSPPDRPCQYTELAEFVRDLQQTTGEGFWIRQPSWMNDKVPGLLTWLQRRKQYYIKRDEYPLWLREYEAHYVLGGKSRIFPMFDRQKIGRPPEWFVENVLKQAHHLNWFCIADPANESVFAVLFGAIHPETKRIYLVDCIYEKDRAKTSIRVMWKRIAEVCAKWHAKLDDWKFAYDDQASWWAVEWEASTRNIEHAPAWLPAGKQTRSKTTGISTIKDVLLENALVANSSTCGPFFNEMEMYSTDDKGEIPKGNDHTIDGFRYMLIVANYDPDAAHKQEIPDAVMNDPWLMAAFKQENPDPAEEDEKLMDDWTHQLFEDWEDNYASS